MKSKNVSLLESIPDVDTIRESLGQKLREAGILRQLLKAAERRRAAQKLQQPPATEKAVQDDRR